MFRVLDFGCGSNLVDDVSPYVSPVLGARVRDHLTSGLRWSNSRNRSSPASAKMLKCLCTRCIEYLPGQSFGIVSALGCQSVLFIPGNVCHQINLFRRIYHRILQIFLNMKLSFIFVFTSLGIIPSQGHYVPPIDHDTRDKQEFGRLVEDIQAKVFKLLDKKQVELHARGQSAQCTSDNIVFRRE